MFVKLFHLSPISCQAVGYCPPECGPPPCQNLLLGSNTYTGFHRNQTEMDKEKAKLCYEIYNCIATDHRMTLTKFDHT